MTDGRSPDRDPAQREHSEDDDSNPTNRRDRPARGISGGRPSLADDPASGPTAPTSDRAGIDPAADDAGRELPEETVEEAERLTRLAREASDEDERQAYLDERAALLDGHEFTARVRRDDDAAVLVLYPDEWIENGTIERERIDDVDRATEVRLSGVGDPEEWAAVDEHNRALVAQVRQQHGQVHGDNAAAFADFVGNHYAKPVGDATGAEVREFIEEYFPRNAWPSEDQRAVVARSIELVYEAAGEPVPDV